MTLELWSLQREPLLITCTTCLARKMHPPVSATPEQQSTGRQASCILSGMGRIEWFLLLQRQGLPEAVCRYGHSDPSIQAVLYT